MAFPRLSGRGWSGLGIVAAAWSLRTYSVVVEVFRHGRPGSRTKTIAIAIVIVFVLVVPVSNAFQA